MRTNRRETRADIGDELEYRISDGGLISEPVPLEPVSLVMFPEIGQEREEVGRKVRPLGRRARRERHAPYRAPNIAAKGRASKTTRIEAIFSAFTCIHSQTNDVPAGVLVTRS